MSNHTSTLVGQWYKINFLSAFQYVLKTSKNVVRFYVKRVSCLLKFCIQPLNNSFDEYAIVEPNSKNIVEFRPKHLVILHIHLLVYNQSSFSSVTSAVQLEMLHEGILLHLFERKFDYLSFLRLFPKLPNFRLIFLNLHYLRHIQTQVA